MEPEARDPGLPSAAALATALEGAPHGALARRSTAWPRRSPSLRVAVIARLHVGDRRRAGRSTRAGAIPGSRGGRRSSARPATALARHAAGRPALRASSSARSGARRRPQAVASAAGEHVADDGRGLAGGRRLTAARSGRLERVAANPARQVAEARRSPARTAGESSRHAPREPPARRARGSTPGHRGAGRASASSSRLCSQSSSSRTRRWSSTTRWP